MLTPEVPMFKAELRLSDLARMDLIRYCLLALEVYESSVSPKENTNFFEITCSSAGRAPSQA